MRRTTDRSTRALGRTRRARLGVALAAGILATMGSLARAAGSEDRWLHIRVQETEGRRETVRVNVPLALLESLAPVLEDMNVVGGKVRVGESDLDAARLRLILEEVRKAPDAEYVTVESDEEYVRVAKSGEYLHVKVRGDGARDRADARIPLAVVDALLSAPDGKIDLAAAVRALGERADGDLVTVSDGSSRVRIWIDGRNTSK